MEINKIQIVEGRVRHGLPMLATCQATLRGDVLSMSDAAFGFGSAAGFGDAIVTNPTHPTLPGIPGSPPV